MKSVDLIDESSVPDPDRPLVAAFDKVVYCTPVLTSPFIHPPMYYPQFVFSH